MASRQKMDLMTVVIWNPICGQGPRLPTYPRMTLFDLTQADISTVSGILLGRYFKIDVNKINTLSITSKTVRDIKKCIERKVEGLQISGNGSPI